MAKAPGSVHGGQIGRTGSDSDFVVLCKEQQRDMEKGYDQPT